MIFLIPNQVMEMLVLFGIVGGAVTIPLSAFFGYLAGSRRELKRQRMRDERIEVMQLERMAAIEEENKRLQERLEAVEGNTLIER